MVFFSRCMIFPFRFWGGGGLTKISPNVKEGIREDHSKNSIKTATIRLPIFSRRIRK